MVTGKKIAYYNELTQPSCPCSSLYSVMRAIIDSSLYIFFTIIIVIISYHNVYILHKYSSTDSRNVEIPNLFREKCLPGLNLTWNRSLSLKLCCILVDMLYIYLLVIHKSVCEIINIF